MNSLKAAT